MNSINPSGDNGMTANVDFGPTLVEGIERRNWSDLTFKRYVREYVIPQKPVIITGALEHWSARTKWTLDFFKESYGHLPLVIDGRKLTMADLISEVEASTPERPAPYLRNHLVSSLPAELQSDIRPMPDCTRPNWLEHPFISFRASLTYVELYIGGRGAKFPVLHYDGLHTHAYLMQLQGIKEYIVYPPDQTPYMYPGKNGLESNSAVDDAEKGDHNRFPLFAKAHGRRFQLYPEETLVVPAGWWHTARILSPSITISINGANSANWSDFSADFCKDYMSGRKLKAKAASVYLTAIGRFLSLQQYLTLGEI